jgi:anti-sigma-K factor RskA
MSDVIGTRADDPVDLSPLDPQSDAARYAQLLDRLSRAVAGELARRRTRGTVWGCLAAWRRPVLATAGVVAVAATLVLATIPRSTATSPTLAEAAGVPSAWARLTAESPTPSPEALLQMELEHP